MKKLVLIDGNSLLNRAFYSTPLFTTKSGMPTNAIFGFVKLLLKINDDMKPDYLIVAFDMKAPTFRHLKYAGYKATRKAMPEDLAAQVEPLKNLLKAMKVATCQQEGIEADDILGTLSKKFGVHSYIYTGDRDSYQLVDEKTDVCFTKRGVSDILHLDISNFKSETGLTPPQIVDYKALTGDSSDNIPGVSGIGDKSAIALLDSYGTLDGVYSHLEEVKPALRTKLENGKELAYLSYDLATIDRNCNLDIKLEDCVAPYRFNEEVRMTFSDFEFKSFLAMDIFDEEAKKEAERQYPEKIEVKNISQLSEALRCGRFAVVPDENSIEIYACGVEYGISASTDLFGLDGVNADDFIGILKEIYLNENNTVIAYDYKRHLKILDGYAITPKCAFEDLSLIKYLCDYEAGDDDLKALCEANSYNFEYCAFALDSLFKEFYEKLKEQEMLKLYEEIEKTLVSVLFEMESEGVRISTTEMEKLSAHYLEEIENYKNKIFMACGKEFNLNSPAQLGEVLYNTFGITEVKKKKTGKYSTGAEILEKLTEKYPVAADILKFRQVQKLNSTYIDGFRPLIDRRNNLVHTTFNQTATSTGRLSSSNPNLQNIPIREDEGRELRKMFIPRDGHIFIDADYSQIELRLLAHFSGCKELIKAYNDNTDVHAVTASQVFGVPIEEVTPKMRREAKAVNFGIIYGISDFGLAKNLDIPTATAREYIQKYFESYSSVKDYMNSNVEFARKNGFVSTLTGRKRVIREINSSNYNLRQFGERAAMNMPLQGSSADIIKIAMNKVARELKDRGLKTKLILQVHDELVLEAPEEEKEVASEILKDCMENAVKLSVPLTVEVHSGYTWYDAK